MPFERRLVNKPAIAAAAFALCVSTPAFAEFRFIPYGSLGANISRLTPEPGNSGFTLSESNSGGVSVLLGADIFDRWSVEAGFNDLGEATLNNAATGDQDITYSTVSFSALFHLFGNSSNIAERRGGWTYLRLGINEITNDSDLELEEANSTAVWAGIGYEWNYSSLLSFRGEIASFDGDAQAVTAAVVFRPFKPPSNSRSGNVQRRPTVPASPTVPTRPTVPSVPTPSDTPSRLPVPVAPTVPSTQTESTRVELAGVQRGLIFVGDTAELTPRSLSSISTLARMMNRAPNARVEIRAHAESANGFEASQTLSRQRVVAVARALVGEGVQVDRLGARAFGNQEPVINSGASAGELLPNRIEFVVSP